MQSPGQTGALCVSDLYSSFMMTQTLLTPPQIRNLFLGLLMLPVGALAQIPEAEPDLKHPLVKGKLAEVTVGDFKSDLLRLPKEMRASFVLDPKRVAASLNNLLTAKTLAAQAKERGLDKDPVNARLIALTVDRALTQMLMDDVEEQANRSFDQSIDAQTRRAREIYAINQPQFKETEQVRAAHILVGTTRLDEAAAAAKAEKLRAEIIAGADFSEYARKHSDDSGSAQNGGDLGYFEHKTMVKPFADAAFAMTKEGELSPVIKTKFGYHIIRYSGRKPERTKSFDEAKDVILGSLRAAYVMQARAKYMQQVHAESASQVDYAAVERLKAKLDPETYRKSVDELLRGEKPR